MQAVDTLCVAFHENHRFSIYVRIANNARANGANHLLYMDIVIEILIEIYMELMFLIIPEEKRNKKALFLTKLIAVLCTLGIIALGVWGIVLLADNHNLWGIAPLTVAIVLSLVQITFGIILFVRRNKK